MSVKDRITLSLSPETTKRLTLVANYRKGAKSALVEEALDRYLDPERRRLLDDAALRRLDTQSKSLSAIARDVAIATETLSLFVRYFLTITPPLPHPEQDSARALGRQRFEVFVAQVGRRLASDNRLVSEVLESIAAHNPDLFGASGDDPPAASPALNPTKLNGSSPPAPESDHG
ncbi:MAG: CopG family transcriptional regulator [Hyphomicrobiaceae bacterium]